MCSESEIQIHFLVGISNMRNICDFRGEAYLREMKVFSKSPTKKQFQNMFKSRLKSKNRHVMREEDFEIIDIFHVRNPD